jgi:predicted Zn-dependent peptidase
MVKNYLLGQSLNLIDGPFATAQLVKSLRAKGLELDRFQLAIEEIKDIDEQGLMDLSRQYFNTDIFTTVLVGQEG